MKRKIFIVEDHEVVRESYVMLFDMAEDLEVCGDVASAEEALERIPDAAPDLVLVDVSLPGMNGLELIRRLLQDDPTLTALVITGHHDDQYRTAALQAGACGFVTKDEGPDALMQAVYGTLANA